MALSENKVVVQNFTGGLNTDSHELNTPQNVTVDEANCDLNRKGFRQRRLGIAYEAGYTQNAAQFSQATMASQYIGKYRWTNINNSGTTNFLVVQQGATLSFYDLAFVPLSAGLKSFTVNLDSYLAPGVSTTANDGVSVDSGNGVLFVCGKFINPFYITYNANTDSIAVTNITIQVRDLIEQDTSAAPDARLSSITAARQYDLYNQGWNTSNVRLYYYNKGPTVEAGPTTVFSYYKSSEGVYPPKTGPWWIGKRIGDKGIEVFDPYQFDSVMTGNTLSSLGHYITSPFNIDRSTLSGIPGLPIVSTNDRPSVCKFFAGKVFYWLGNTIYYSQTITNANDLSGVGKCYQEADPTSEQVNNLVATDGGTITIPESAEPVAFFTIENSLLAFSSNGTWIVSGSSTNSGFAATDYSINKISSVSCLSPRTLIDADGIPIWWAQQGIYTLKPISTKQSFTVENISLKRVQNFYDAIAPLAKINATGAWDHIQKRAIWLFSSNPDQSSTTNRFYYNDILVLDLLFDAYLHHTISDYSVLPCSKMVDAFNIQTIQVSTAIEVITDNSGNPIVDHMGAGVTVNTDTLINNATVTHDVNYIVVGPVGVSGATDSTDMTLAFADFTSCDFLDWSDYTTIGLGADYTSYLDAYYTIAGYMTPHFTPAFDAMMWMYSPYIYAYLDQPARACQTTVITIPGTPPGTTTNKLLAYNVTDAESYINRGILVDFVNDYVYRFGTSTNNGLLRQFEGLNNGNEIAFTTGNTLGYEFLGEGSQKCVTYAGWLVFYTSNNGNPLVVVDPATLKVVSTFPTGGIPPTSTHISTPWSMAPLRFGATEYVISSAQAFLTPGKWLQASSVPNLNNTPIAQIDEHQAVVGRGAVGATSGTVMVIGIPTFGGGAGVGIYVVTGNASGFSLSKKGVVLPSQVDATWTDYTSADGVAYDQTDGNMIFIASNTAAASGHKAYLVKVNSATGVVMWTSAITTSLVNAVAVMGQWNIVTGNIYYMDSSNLLRIIKTSDGSQTTQTLTTMGQANTLISDDVSNSMVLGQANWTESSPTPTYFGTFFTNGGSHVLNSQDARWFVGGITTPGTPDTFLYETTVTPNASSCLLQVAWDWSSSSASHKWSQQLECYKYRANFFVATSRNKVRGKGKAMQVRFSSSTGKDFNLIGWGIWYTKNQHP